MFYTPVTYGAIYGVVFPNEPKNRPILLQFSVPRDAHAACAYIYHLQIYAPRTPHILGCIINLCARTSSYYNATQLFSKLKAIYIALNPLDNGEPRVLSGNADVSRGETLHELRVILSYLLPIHHHAVLRPQALKPRKPI